MTAADTAIAGHLLDHRAAVAAAEAAAAQAIRHPQDAEIRGLARAWACEALRALRGALRAIAAAPRATP